LSGSFLVPLKVIYVGSSVEFFIVEVASMHFL
jgi:hypothetical protein